MRSSPSSLCLLSLVCLIVAGCSQTGASSVEQHVRRENGRLGRRQAAPDRHGRAGDGRFASRPKTSIGP